MTSQPHPQPASDLDEFTLLPGLYQRGELEQLVTSDADFHIEAAGLELPALGLFRVYRQPMNHVPPRPRGRRPAPKPQRGVAEPPADLAAATAGELKARHHEEQLCYRCRHRAVCGVATAAEPHLLVTIGQCLAFWSSDDEPCVVELQPIEPLPHPEAAAGPAEGGCCASEE